MGMTEPASPILGIGGMDEPSSQKNLMKCLFKKEHWLFISRRGWVIFAMPCIT